MDTDRRTEEQIENQDEKLKKLQEHFKGILVPKKNPNDLIINMMKASMDKERNKKIS